MRKTIATILSIILFMTVFLGLFQSKVEAATQLKSNNISEIDNTKYPGIKSMIQNLQKQHPTWKFKVLYTGLDWNTVITQESKHGNNLVPKSYTYWVCPVCGNKGYSGSNWLCASSAAIAYMMDPRNSLYYEDVFQFLELSYDTNVQYDKNIIRSILAGSFLDDGKLDSYIDTIVTRCSQKNVNPYYIAGKIIQEQGKKGGSTWKMQTTVDGVTKYYYNIFNINACGTTTSAIISNALAWAKAKGWDTIEKCLNGGVDFIANGYITVGQDTMYFEKFDVIADSYYSHQYAQDVLYAQNQGEKLRRILENINATEYAYTFVIPLYENMPSSACPRPTAGQTTSTDGGGTTTTDVTQGEDSLILHSSSMKVSENNIILNADITLKELKELCNVQSADKDGVIITDNMNLSTGTTIKIEDKIYTIIKLADINGDGYVDTGDTLVAKQVVLGKKKVEGIYKTAMDVNQDTFLDTGDTLILKKFILGIGKIQL